MIPATVISLIVFWWNEYMMRLKLGAGESTGYKRKPTHLLVSAMMAIVPDLTYST
jgi:hypothetical protein